MDTSLIAQYGVMGLWVGYMIYKEKTFYEDMKRSIDNNTVASNKIVSVIEYIKK